MFLILLGKVWMILKNRKLFIKNELNQPQAENQKNAVPEGGDSLDEMLKSLQK